MAENTFETSKEKIPKANFYFIEVRDGVEYDVRAAKCPTCGAENTDIEPGLPCICFKCKNEFEIGQLDGSNNKTI
jgi:hypothetical protein